MFSKYLKTDKMNIRKDEAYKVHNADIGRYKKSY